MQTKTIKKVIKSKLSEWFNSITDDKVRKIAMENTIVTGGSIASMLLNEKVNDFDIYFRTKEAVKIIAKYYVDKENVGIEVIDGANFVKDKNFDDPTNESQWNIFCRNIDPTRVKLFIGGMGYYSKNGETKFEDENTADEQKSDGKYEAIYFTENAITLTDQIQLVIRFWGEPNEIHENYDFVHATNYYNSKEDKLELHKEALEALLTKQLKYIGSKYPLTSIIRTKKFIKRGFNIGAGEYLKILFQVSELDLRDPVVLQEQLVGVDIAYFSVLLEALIKIDKDKVTYEYICEIIDRIFN